MGDIADWILEGGACQSCGVYFDDGGELGYPRTCAGCKGAEAVDDAAHPVNKIECQHPGCRKRFKTNESASQHYIDKHGERSRR